jgi:hypothetical protein
MPQISLTDFVDIVSKSGTPKATNVKQVKSRPAYSPGLDFYRPLRTAIADVHREGKPSVELYEFLKTVSDPKKIKRYQSAVNGYVKWWSKNKLEWFEPVRSDYTSSGIDVSINPEIGLLINSQRRYLIKLYFKDEPLAKLRVDLITVLMETALRPRASRAEIMSVLDVNKGKLFSLSVAVAPTRAAVDAELAYIANLWPNV